MLQDSFQKHFFFAVVLQRWLVLQLHDELIYEVSGEDVLQVAKIVKSGMETAMKLLVPTPVRVKVGATWGELQDFQVDRKT